MNMVEKVLSEEFVDTSISHATLVTYHLVTTGISFLRSCGLDGMAEFADEIQAESDALPKGDPNYGDDYAESAGEDAMYLWERVFDKLNEIAPEGTCFGSHEGNGSDFGFWRYDPDDDF